MIILYVLLAIIAIVILWLVAAYYSLVVNRQEVKNAWLQIGVQLKHRHDLIPNLVEAVKGYVTHEKETLKSVIKARNQAVSAEGFKGKAQADNFLTQSLKLLFAASERYPDLKANQNVASLQEELTSTENRISFVRQFYNDQSMRLNTAIESVRTNIVANATGSTKIDFLEIEDTAHREVPKVKLN